MSYLKLRLGTEHRSFGSHQAEHQERKYTKIKQKGQEGWLSSYPFSFRLGLGLSGSLCIAEAWFSLLALFCIYSTVKFHTLEL